MTIGIWLYLMLGLGIATILDRIGRRRGPHMRFTWAEWAFTIIFWPLVLSYWLVLTVRSK